MHLAVLGQADRVEGAAGVLALLGVGLAVALRLRARQRGDRLRGRGAMLRRLCALRAFPCLSLPCLALPCLALPVLSLLSVFLSCGGDLPLIQDDPTPLLYAHYQRDNLLLCRNTVAGRASRLCRCQCSH